MHCPYCSAALVDSDGEFRCSASGALFSRSVSDTFRQRYADISSAFNTETAEAAGVGIWFCPGCGVRLRDHMCAQCGQALEMSLLQALLELNPHVAPVD